MQGPALGVLGDEKAVLIASSVSALWTAGAGGLTSLSLMTLSKWLESVWRPESTLMEMAFLMPRLTQTCSMLMVHDGDVFPAEVVALLTGMLKHGRFMPSYHHHFQTL